jgi:hypothetical protein
LIQNAVRTARISVTPLRRGVTVTQELQSGKLIALLTGHAAPGMRVNVLYSAERRLPQRASVFNKFITQDLANVDGLNSKKIVPHSHYADDPLGSYMDAPGLPSIHFMMSQQEKIAPVHPDFGAAVTATVPDGIC